MGWLQSMIYGLVSGLAEFLPISSLGHEVLLFRILGIDAASAFARLMNHMALMATIIFSCKSSLKNLYQEWELNCRPFRRRSRQPNKRSVCDVSLIKTAFFPLALGFFCYPYTSRLLDDVAWVAFFLAINGVFLIIPAYIWSGNKDSLSMSRFDSVLFGVFGALGVIPGISRMAATTLIGSLRGADRQQTLHWSLLLSIPALCFLIGFDLRDLILTGFGVQGFMGLIQCVIGSGFAFLGGNFAIQLMRFLSYKTGYAGFSFYCWGAALFMFVLYLI